MGSSERGTIIVALVALLVIGGTFMWVQPWALGAPGSAEEAPSAAAVLETQAASPTSTATTASAGPRTATAIATRTATATFAPAVPGRVTIGLAASEDSNVRVTVDGAVRFDGVMRAGQRESWEGARVIQVWTNKGKTIALTVNGKDLGPYSPAMGHPEWNTIDFAFSPTSNR